MELSNTMATTKMEELSSTRSMECKDWESLASATSVSSISKSVRFKALKSEVELLKEQVKLLLEKSKLDFDTVKQEKIDTVTEDIAKDDDFHAEDVVDEAKPVVVVTKAPTQKTQGVAKDYLKHLSQTEEEKKKSKMKALETEESAALASSKETTAQPLPSGNDEDDIIEEIKSAPPKEGEEKSVVLSGIHNQSEPGTWKVVAHHDATSEVREEHANRDMNLMCGSGGGGERVKKSEKRISIRKMVSRLFRGAKSVKKMDSSNIKNKKSINKPSAGMETPTGGADANPAESVTIDGGDMSDSKQHSDDDDEKEEEGGKDASNAKPVEVIQVEKKEDSSQQRSIAELDPTLGTVHSTPETSEEHTIASSASKFTKIMTSSDDVVGVDKSSPEVEEAVAEEKSTQDNDGYSVASSQRGGTPRVTEKEADFVSKAKAETSQNDSENQEESPLAEGSTKPELDAIAVPENNNEEDEECDKSTTSSRRSRVTFKASKSEDEESVRSKPRQGTVSHLREKFNRLARSPSINRVSSGFSSIGKPKNKVPVKVYDNGPLEKTERDDKETTRDENNIFMDLVEPDSMKRTYAFNSAPSCCGAKRSEEKTLSPLSLQEEEILQVESVTSRCLNDDEDNCEIEIEAVDKKSSSLRRSPPPNTEPEAISLAVKRVVSV